jgi:hypothetical protein
MDSAFDPLTNDLSDLRLTHEACWLWPQLSAEFDRLETVIEPAQALLQPLTTGGIPNWLREAALGIARSNAAIHQHAERRGSYVAAARSLWTTRIPPHPTAAADALRRPDPGAVGHSRSSLGSGDFCRVGRRD